MLLTTITNRLHLSIEQQPLVVQIQHSVQCVCLNDNFRTKWPKYLPCWFIWHYPYQV